MMVRLIRARPGSANVVVLLVLLATAPALAQRPEGYGAWVAAASNDFGFTILRKLVTDTAGRSNVSVAPNCVWSALAMTWAGTGAETRQEMGRVLGFGDVPRDNVGEGYRGLMTLLKEDRSGIELQTASAVWALNGTDLARDYVQHVSGFYEAPAIALTGSADGIADRINAWAHQNTGGKVDELVSPRDLATGRDAAVVLTTAAYFRGAWAQPFDPATTKDGVFTTATGTQKRVRMMHGKKTTGYLKAPGYEAVRLPFRGSPIRLVILLPAPGSSPAAVIADLTTNRFDAALARMPASEVKLSLPRFRTNYAADVGPALRALGIRAAFDGRRADFRPMGLERGAFIGFVNHRAVLDVDEQGATAAAATAVGIGRGAPPQPVTMVVDRPFVYAIQDTRTGTILFMGVVADPQPL